MVKRGGTLVELSHYTCELDVLLPNSGSESSFVVDIGWEVLASSCLHPLVGILRLSICFLLADAGEKTQ